MSKISICIWQYFFWSISICFMLEGFWGMFYDVQLCHKQDGSTNPKDHKQRPWWAIPVNPNQFTIHSICSCITLIHIVSLFIVSLGTLCNCNSICSIIKKLSSLSVQIMANHVCLAVMNQFPSQQHAVTRMSSVVRKARSCTQSHKW